MEQINQRYSYKNGFMVDNGRNSWGVIRLAFAGEYKKIPCRSNVKMKAFISITTTVCFLFSTIASASIHTLIETANQRTVLVKLIHMPLRELTEYEI